MNYTPEKPMRILVIGPVPPPYAGGIASFVDCMRRSPKLEKFEFQYLNNLKSGRDKSTLLGRAVFSLRLTIRLLKLLRESGPALVHIHSSAYYSFYEKAWMLFICRLFGKKVILHLHDGRYKEFHRRSPLKGLHRFVLNRAAAVFAVSASWREYFRGLCRVPVYEIPNCAAPLFFDGPPESPGRDILFVGPLSRGKGSDDLLNALRLLRDKGYHNRVLLAGGGSSQRELEHAGEMISSLELGDVEIVIAQSPEEVRELLRQAAVFVLPSYAEGLPVSMLEAMAAGVPLVVTRVGGIPDAVTDSRNGFLVEPGDTTGLAEKLGCLLSDPRLCREIGQSNRELAAGCYHPDQVAEILAETYLELL